MKAITLQGAGMDKTAVRPCVVKISRIGRLTLPWSLPIFQQPGTQAAAAVVAPSATNRRRLSSPIPCGFSNSILICYQG
jgi:hypothetical protein